MTRKTADCYSAVFNFIEEKLFKLQPTEMMTDFEEGMRKSIKQKWPNVVLRGCWFHFCRAILKRSIKLGLKRFIKRNERAKAIRKALMSIPLLPAENIDEGFDSIVKYAKKWRLYSRFSRLFGYFRNYWLGYQVRLT